MLEITFRINGKKVRPNQISDVIERTVYESVKSELTKKLSDIRDPETGHSPKIIVKGRNLDSLSIEATGSQQIIDLVKERLEKG